MSWRNQSNHKEETKAVKAALKQAGITASVGHGTGTAYCWLEINVGKGNGNLRDRTLRIAQDVTGRHGDYCGCINVLTQD